MAANNEELKIEFMPDDDSVIHFVRFNNTYPNAGENNISDLKASPNGNVLYEGSSIQTPNEGARPFILGEKATNPDGTITVVGGSKLDGKSVFANSYDGYISNSLWNGTQFVNDKRGTANDTFDIYVSGYQMNHIFIYFDRVVNQFPLTIIFNKGQADEATITNDNTVFIYAFTARDNFTISFADWNVNDFVRFTGLFVGLTERYNRYTGLKDLRRGSENVADNTQPTNGVLGQYGDLQILDIHGVIRELEELNLITADTKATLLANNVVIGKYLFNSWAYDRNAGSITVDFRDTTDRWHNIIVPDQILEEDETALDLYNLLTHFDNTAEYAPLSAQMNSYLSGLNIKYFYLDSGTLWEAWNKFGEEAKVLIGLNAEGQVAVTFEETG